MQSIVDVTRDVVENKEILERSKVFKGLDAFMDDESMIDDLENDLQSAGLRSGKDYILDLDKGTLTIKKSTPGLKNVLRIYRLKEEAVEEENKDINKDNVEKAIQHD
jgi:hypothetical protein